MREVVAVLRGGPSNEYAVSLKSGAQVLSSLNTEGFEPRDIFIDTEGQWHRYGVAMPPEQALLGADVVFNALHGEYGEDGKVQRLLDRMQIPYTGSGAEASALAYHKKRANDVVASLGISVPHSIVVHPEGDTEELALKLFRSFPHPAIIKPVVGGSSVGMTLADSFFALQQGLQLAAGISPAVLVEEYIKGREATVGVVERMREEKVYALMPVEITHAQRPFFDYEAKYAGKATKHVPSHFSSDEKEVLVNAARRIHTELGLAHYSRSDFIVSKRGIYFLEVNTLPGLTKDSLLPLALDAGGITMPIFIEHVLSLARNR